MSSLTAETVFSRRWVKVEDMETGVVGFRDDFNRAGVGP
jgi:hypothetical protein